MIRTSKWWTWEGLTVVAVMVINSLSTSSASPPGVISNVQMSTSGVSRSEAGTARPVPISVMKSLPTLSRAMELAEKGKHEDAVRVCDELIRKGDFDAQPALRQKGLSLHRLGRFADACLCWEYMLSGRMAQSKDDDIVLKLASTYAFSLRQPAKAEKYYQRLLKQWPRSKYLPDAQYQYAGIRYEAKDFTNAVSLFREHLRDFPNSPYSEKAKEYLDLCGKAIEVQETAAMIAKVRAEKASIPVIKKSRVQQEFKAAESLFARKLYKEALKSYQMVKNDLYCVERDAAIYRMGQCCSELGRDDEAIRLWEMSSHPRCGDTNSYFAAQSLKAIGDTYFDKLAEEEPAMKYYRQLVAAYPEDPLVPSIMEKIGIIYLYQGKTQEARLVFEQLQPKTPRDPNEPPTGLDRLIALCDGQVAKQLPDLKMVARDNRAAVALRKADIFFTAKRYEEALHAYEDAEALARGTEHAAYALMQKGRCHNQLLQFQKAVDCYESFLHRDCRSKWASEALVRAGVVYAGPMNDKVKAAKMYQTVLEKHGNSTMAETAKLYLATLAFWARDWRKALQLHNEFIQEYPASPYVGFVQEARIPTITTMLKSGKSNGKG